jgi:hypothetical protein
VSSQRGLTLVRMILSRRKQMIRFPLSPPASTSSAGNGGTLGPIFFPRWRNWNNAERAEVKDLVQPSTVSRRNQSRFDRNEREIGMDKLRLGWETGPERMGSGRLTRLIDRSRALLFAVRDWSWTAFDQAATSLLLGKRHCMWSDSVFTYRVAATKYRTVCGWSSVRFPALPLRRHRFTL